MNLSKNFEPAAIETKWTAIWKDKKYFKSVPNSKPPFTVVIPPPNVTGVLHMGHSLNETVQDILVRRARMNGYNACWVPGSDHASIATESKVVQMLKEEKGIDKNTLTREDFLKYAFEWKEKYGGIIYNQIERLGCSVDWDRVTFTMDDHYYEAVIKTFMDLYNKGLIYRGARMIHWDPVAKTALSDEEVEYKEVQSKLYYVRYKLDHRDDYITVATTRPETILGDTAICVNPDDERYKHLKGAYAFVPLINRRIPIIFDEYVDKEFGTGALKITPAHDINDYNIGLKHHLEIIDTLNDDGTLSEAAQLYVGEDRFEVRKKIAADLEQSGNLVKTEDIINKNGFSQRSHAVVEPKISTQWFLKMKDLAKPALHAVVNGDIKIHPGDKCLATYKHWLENVKDWCISRQLWWGQRIPAWYAPNGTFVVAENKEAALKKFQELNLEIQMQDLRQDEDVLDTWFSSWLWPSEVFHGITHPGNEEIKYYYPVSVLVTGQDIIFFWVARMVMAGLEFEKEIPFRNVYFTGMVRDHLGRKMSKQLGNSPDLLQLIDTYGADAVRFGIMIAAPAGNDLLFDESSLEQGRNFNNKLWNALKLIKLWETNPNGITNDSAEINFADEWMENRIRQAKKEINYLFDEYKLSEALKTIYSLIWDDFCSWYLEWQKPPFGGMIVGEKLANSKKYFIELLALLHPFMPFVTEEIHSILNPESSESLCITQLQAAQETDEKIIAQGELLKSAISAIREARVKNNIKTKEPIQLFIQSSRQNEYNAIAAILQKQTNIETIGFTETAIENAVNLLLDKDKLFIQTQTALDTSAQKEQIAKDLKYFEGFLTAIEKKLSNEKFVANAKPEIVEIERKKKADAEEKIKLLKETLGNLMI
jgi:valyl-tRNA synthetase